jgi:hypothetical protein
VPPPPLAYAGVVPAVLPMLPPQGLAPLHHPKPARNMCKELSNAQVSLQEVPQGVYLPGLIKHWLQHRGIAGPCEWSAYSLQRSSLR